ncbi:MAG: iron-containing alcohol dehydrogenase [Bacillota bacterium]
MLKSFAFNLPTRIEFGTGLLASTGKLARGLKGKSRVFVITDPGVKKTGLTGIVIDSLANKGFECHLFDRVKPNPRDVDCEAGGEEAASFGAEFIVAVGGGSVLDSAKAIALLHRHGGPLQAYEGKGKVIRPIIPIVAVPTTAGTGSEVTRSAVITDTKRNFKMTVNDILLAPKLAVVDPETTYSLPADLSASTGMDALVHAVEAYTCREANPFSDMLALAAIENIYPSLEAAVRENNRQARDSMMFGSLLAGLAFSHADVGAVHCMAETVGGFYDIPHGVANSMFLPVVTAFNASADPQRHARIAEVCGLAVTGMADHEAAELLITELANMAAKIGIPRFAELEEVDPADFPPLARMALVNGSTPSNCRTISESEYLELFVTTYNS